MEREMDFKAAAVHLWRFFAYSTRRFWRDECPQVAAALSYSSLLSVVPLLAIFLGLLSAFPAFEELRITVQEFIFDTAIPEVGIEVSDYLAGFVENASKMTGFGLLALGVTAVLLLSTITTAFNSIWRVQEPRSLVLRLLVYWAVLTLGPILLGASLSLSTYGFALAGWAGVQEYGSNFGMTQLLPFALAAGAFTVLYMLVPARSVRFRHALAGALVAAFLFELLKRGFGFYLAHFPSYQAVYGALAAIPIFLIWMYLSWAVVLFGAEIAASFREWRVHDRLGHVAVGPGARLALALAILSRLRSASRGGVIMREAALFRDLPADFEQIGYVLRNLRRNGYVVRSGFRWVLSQDLTTVTLRDLMRCLKITFEPGSGWPEPVKQAVTLLSDAGAEVSERTLAEIFDEVSASTPITLDLRSNS